MALSTGEAEYYTAGEAVKEAQWLKSLITEMGATTAPYILKCDSKTALASIANPIISARNKHIELRHRFIRDIVSEGAALLYYVPSKLNLAGGLTKALRASEHFRLFQATMRALDTGREEGTDVARASPKGKESPE